MAVLKSKEVGLQERRAGSSTSRRRLPRQSLRDQAYEAIKDRIITCAFKPGEVINEASVSALLGLGRTLFIKPSTASCLKRWLR